MTQEEISTKAKEIAVEHSRIWNDQEIGRISTEGECYYSAMKMAKWIIEEMAKQEKPINVLSTACILSDELGDKLVVTTNLNALKGYEIFKNGIKNNSDKALVQQALDKARDLSNTIEGALAGEKPYPETYYRMCEEVIELLTKIKGTI